MGQDGEELLNVLGEVEKFGGIKIDKIQLNELAKAFPKVGEYDRVINAAIVQLDFRGGPRVSQTWCRRRCGMRGVNCTIHICFSRMTSIIVQSDR